MVQTKSLAQLANVSVLQVLSDITEIADYAQQTQKPTKILTLVYVKMVSLMMHNLITVYLDVDYLKYGHQKDVNVFQDTAGMDQPVDNAHKKLNQLVIKEDVYALAQLLFIFLILISV